MTTITNNPLIMESNNAILFEHDDKARCITNAEAYQLITLALMVLNNSAMCHAIQTIQNGEHHENSH
jgi:hypothetical protein